MKKLMTAVLSVSLLTGASAIAFGQEQPKKEDTKKDGKKDGGKKDDGKGKLHARNYTLHLRSSWSQARAPLAWVWLLTARR